LAEHSKIADVAPRIQHTATGSQTHFDYTFPIFDDAGLEVYLDDVRQTSGFEVHDAGNSSGDTLTFESPPASGALLTLYRQILIERTIDFLREWKISKFGRLPILGETAPGACTRTSSTPASGMETGLS
jgi:hypothetical protein